MKIKDSLTLEQKRKLQQVLHNEESSEIREISLILLLLNDGKTPQEVVKFLGCSSNKVEYWHILWRDK